MINFNPSLRHNDSLTPEEIARRAEQRNEKTRRLTEQAYLAADVPPSAAERAADHAAVTRQTAEAKKARRDAATWAYAQDGKDPDCYILHSEDDD